MTVRLHLLAPDGIEEVTEGTDLAALVVTAVPDLADGDVVVLTSKVVSKAEGRTTTGSRDDAIAAETVRVVARRGPTSIVENHLGLVMAAAGVDASNVEAGRLVLLPRDPDATARDLRETLLARTGRNVAVLVTDTAGRAWRNGQTDLAIGAAGMAVLDDHAGRVDSYGNPLEVTAPAVVDEIAGAAELATGKLGGRPLTVVRGLGDRVLPPGEHGPGARTLPRPLAGDMFALGTREAVMAALLGESAASFGGPVPGAELIGLLDRLGLAADQGADGVRLAGSPDPASYARAEALAHAHGWVAAPVPGPDGLPRFQPRTP